MWQCYGALFVCSFVHCRQGHLVLVFSRLFLLPFSFLMVVIVVVVLWFYPIGFGCLFPQEPTQRGRGRTAEKGAQSRDLAAENTTTTTTHGHVPSRIHQ